YAKAYSKDAEFYAFYRSLSAYETSLGNTGDIMVIEPDSEFFRYFKKKTITPPTQPKTQQPVPANQQTSHNPSAPYSPYSYPQYYYPATAMQQHPQAGQQNNQPATPQLLPTGQPNNQPIMQQPQKSAPSESLAE
ncbi:MAG: hypothetical protein KAG20_09835, partial [Cocleimonas sp.]|nr:hypothetical protein [Cocleimonas sp.]